jgi:Leucine-rich repeat (LRR) protein
MPLTDLTCSGTQVSDLSPLKGMKLRTLNCDRTQVADLAPLQGMRLTNLFCGETRIADLSPIRGAPLTHLRIDRTDIPGSMLAEFPELEVINLDAAQIETLPVLNQVWAVHLSDADNKSLKILGDLALPKLTSIMLLGYKKFTKAGIDALQEKYPACKIQH